ncbi:hypothetical protein [Paraburkholderia solisilvae]|uniref:Nicotinate-nucleotide adenylyltransferase n=1 Tax=Paraburkholderia solisilvae TaxID=624376 RepID=A0A6J5E3F1_9BURK|nr:hypothetical protein [Paraburkholderia solisilvae]CAB3759592.1 hypothetical protein LMG29739_03193 [Paraburkholderia solisilvae]
MKTANVLRASIVIRSKSRLYAWLAVAVPIAVVWANGAALTEVMLASSFGLAACAALIPASVARMIQIEDAIGSRVARVVPGRLARLVLNAPLVLVVSTFVGAATGRPWTDVPMFCLLCGAAGGLHALAFRCAYRGVGERKTNLVLAIAMSAWLVAACVVEPQSAYAAALCATAYVLDLVIGALADLRSWWHPHAGVGVFFGSFNPAHNSHLRIIRDALDKRRLDKIYVHCTTVPKLHRQALERGEIGISRDAGMRVYHRTALADPGKNYFPTGNCFYEYEVRKELLRAACDDAGLTGRVDVLDLPEIYERDGFIGVLREVRRRHAGQPLHGLHGSDTGGMWVRNLFDDSGWVYPYAVVRSDQVSATAIRNGATGLASPTVERFLAAARAGQPFTFASGYRYDPSGAVDREPDRSPGLAGTPLTTPE